VAGAGHKGKNLVLWVAAVAVAGLALYVLLPSLTAVLGAWPRLSTLNLVWLAPAAVAEAASFTCTFALQRLVLRTKAWFAVATAGITGNAVTNVLPGGDAAGAGVQFRMLATAGIAPDTAAGGLTASSMLGVGGLLTLPLFSLPAVLGGSRASSGLVHAALVGLVGFFLFAICSLVVIATNRPLAIFGRLVQSLWNHIARHRTPVTGLDIRLLDQRNAVRSALGQKWCQAFLLVAGRLALDYLCLLGALRATGADPRPALVLLAYSTANVLALVPITPGGLGIVEASLSGMLVLAGVGAKDAFVATLAYRLASYWLPLVSGPVAYLLFRHRYGRVK
jgi:uncharacterized protein (TIRG00374 family)